MIIYVESNFVVELAARQEQHRFCEQLLDLAESGDIRLLLPAFSVAEPIETLHRRQSKRTQLQADLGAEIRLLSRSASFEEKLRQAAEVMSVLDESRRQEQQRLDAVLERIGAAGEIIALDPRVVTRARCFERNSA